jgi:hypothetical protein
MKGKIIIWILIILVIYCTDVGKGYGNYNHRQLIGRVLFDSRYCDDVKKVINSIWGNSPFGPAYQGLWHVDKDKTVE